eukprot:TRINITY_DN22379_c0_g1_i1.p1 TRINITY_DN22379_c0_g1~~TRINITY_DN22379_c0_g1_i1.p1  ORF type:complete len:472 (+),score=205.37 TRINITY_DN22379_c0_g1_i1:92-1417(+)
MSTRTLAAQDFFASNRETELQNKETRERQLQERKAQEMLQRRDVIHELQSEFQAWRRAQDVGTSKHGNSGARYGLSGQESKVKPRSALHGFMSWVTWSVKFDHCIMATIFVNVLFIAVESSLAPQERGSAFEVADLVFFTIYLVEFLLKVYVEPIGYWKSNYNRFDFLIVLTSCFQFVRIDGLDIGFVRVLRALRALRALRSISFVRALRVLVNALIKTLGSIRDILFLLLLIMYIFSIVGFYFFGVGGAGTSAAEDWETLGAAMYTLWVYTTVDGWTDIQDRLDESGFKTARIFTILFIFVGHFVFTNLFVGVIIQNLDEAQSEEKMFQQLKKQIMVDIKQRFLRERQQRDLANITQVLKGERMGSIRQSIEQLEEGDSVRQDDLVPMTDLVCNLTWVRTYLRSLDFYESSRYRTQQVHFDLANTLGALAEARYQHHIHA